MPDQTAGAPASAPVFVVLDTNVVLDLLVFDDPRSQPLARALHGGSLLALATTPMHEELADVLARPFLAPRQLDVAAMLARAKALCRLVETPAAASPTAPRCADPDDQIFIDLAWAWPAAWLFSRDRALLALDRRTQSRGLSIVTPAAWAASPQRLAAPANAARP